MTKEVLSHWLHDYFINLDEPPATRLLVPEDKIQVDKNDKDIVRATLIYVYNGEYEKVHTARIKFNSSNLDGRNFDVNYQYIDKYLDDD